MEKEYKRALEVAQELRDKATWDNNKEIVKVCEQIIPELGNIDVKSRDEIWNDGSIGHVFFKHYLEDAAIDKLSEILGDLRQSVIYEFVGSSEMTEDELNYIKVCKQIYEKIKRTKLNLEERGNMMKYEDHIKFMKYIEKFSLDD
jgi:hypothetical protein